MRLFANGEFIEINIEATVILGKVVDPRVVLLEQIVADHYDINVNELNNWKFNTEPKQVLCFMLYKYCKYTIASISRQYNIDRFYLKNCITTEIITCLENSEREALIMGLFNGVNNNISQAS